MQFDQRLNAPDRMKPEHRTQRTQGRPSANEMALSRQPDQEVQGILLAEAAEAAALAQRAVAPDAGRQDWLAVEEVAVRYTPGQEKPTSREVCNHTECLRRGVSTRMAKSVPRRKARRRQPWKAQCYDRFHRPQSGKRISRPDAIPPPPHTPSPLGPC
jgi:hypothetical protein